MPLKRGKLCGGGGSAEGRKRKRHMLGGVSMSAAQMLLSTLHNPVQKKTTVLA